jgi:hypothetical protein
MEEQAHKATSLKRHRSGASLDTNASGISFNTLVTKQLPKFPQPPSEIPPSPLGTEFGTPLTTPIRSHFNATPPLTPRRKGFQNDFRLPTTSIGSSSSPNTIRQGCGDSDIVSNVSHMVMTSSHESKGADSRPSISSIVRPEGKGSPKTNHPSPLASHSPQNAVSPLPSPKTSPPIPRLPSKPSRRPPALKLVPKGAASRPLPAYSSPVASPHDWHEGSSGIVVDANEDRMLSTSFITELLTSTQNIFEESSLPYTREQQPNSGSSFPETTFPSLPFPSTIEQTPAPPSAPTLPSQHSEDDRAPLTYPLSNLSRSSSSAAHCPPSDSEIPQLRPEDEQPSIVRAVSTSKSAVRGVSVVGYASATLHRLPGASNSQLSLNNSSQVASSLLTDQLKPREPNTVFNHYPGQKMTAPFVNDPAPATYSPAFPPAAEVNTQFRDGERTHRSARQSIHSTRSTKSYVSSLISRISHAPAAVLHRFRPKPLPPLPVQTSISIIAQSGHQKVESIVTLPAQVDSPGTFSEMSERGFQTQDSLLQLREYKGGYSESMGATGRMKESWQHHGSKLSRRVPNPERWNTIPDVPKIHDSRMAKKKKRILFAIAILVVIVVVAVTLGVVFGTREEHRARGCRENFTGAACTLGKQLKDWPDL